MSNTKQVADRARATSSSRLEGWPYLYLFPMVIWFGVFVHDMEWAKANCARTDPAGHALEGADRDWLSLDQTLTCRYADE